MFKFAQIVGKKQFKYHNKIANKIHNSPNYTVFFFNINVLYLLLNALYGSVKNMHDITLLCENRIIYTPFPVTWKV